MTINDLMALDMAFCDAVSKRGATAWGSYFMQDGLMLVGNGDNIISEQAIYEAMKGFFDRKGNSLIWSPEGGSLSDDASLGYTYGKYIRIQENQEGKKEQTTGRYMTVWRKQINGHYKIEVDMGN